MSDFDRQRERQRGGQSVRDGGDISSTATPGKQTLAPGAGASAPATQAAPAPAPAGRSPFDAAAEPIRDHLNRARQLLVRLTTARASNDHDTVNAVTNELRSCLQSACEGIERAQPSPAIDALRPQLAETERQAELFLGNTVGSVGPTVAESAPATSAPAGAVPESTPDAVPKHLAEHYQQEIAHENLQPGSAPGYFFTPAVRVHLATNTKTRVSAARDAYYGAIQELEVAALLKKEQDLGIVTTLVIGAVFGNVGAALIGAAKAVKSIELVQKQLEQIGESVPSAVFASSMKEVSEKQLDAVIGTAVDATKDAIKDAAKADRGAESDKDAALEYLHALQTLGAEMFQNLSEMVIPQLDDSELVMYWNAFDALRNTIPIYHEKLAAKLNTFMSSQARAIGRSNTTVAKDNSPIIRETRVAWFVSRSGGKRLAYVHRDFDEVAVAAIERETTAGAKGAWTGVGGCGATSYGDSHVDGDTEVAGIKGLTNDDVFGGFVEPDLVEVALKRHEETWRYQPRTYVVPDYALNGPLSGR